MCCIVWAVGENYLTNHGEEKKSTVTLVSHWWFNSKGLWKQQRRWILSEYCDILNVYGAAKIPSHITHTPYFHVTKDIYKRTSHREQPQVSEDSLSIQATDQNNSYKIPTGIPRSRLSKWVWEFFKTTAEQTLLRWWRHSWSLMCSYWWHTIAVKACSLLSVLQFHRQPLANRWQQFNPSPFSGFIWMMTKKRQHLQHYWERKKSVYL